MDKYTNKGNIPNEAEYVRRSNLNPDDFEEKVEKDFTRQKESELNNNQ